MLLLSKHTRNRREIERGRENMRIQLICFRFIVGCGIHIHVVPVPCCCIESCLQLILAYFSFCQQQQQNCFAAVASQMLLLLAWFCTIIRFSHIFIWKTIWKTNRPFLDSLFTVLSRFSTLVITEESDVELRWIIRSLTLRTKR